MKNKFLSKIVLLTLILCLTVTLSGCGTKENSDKDESTEATSSKEVKESEKKDLSVFEYMGKITPENTVEEINKIIGTDGELVEEKYNKYSWKITDDTTLTATYYSSKTATIKVEIDDNFLKDDKTDLSCAKDIKSEINSANGIKYDDFVSKIGTKGYVIEKSSSSTTYRWVNSKGGYLRATFSNSSGKCTFFSAYA